MVLKFVVGFVIAFAIGPLVGFVAGVLFVVPAKKCLYVTYEDAKCFTLSPLSIKKISTFGILEYIVS